MARANRYASVNFNEIYGQKKPSSSPSSPAPSQNAPLSATTRPHGRMVVLTRPLKPQTPQIPSPSPSPNPASTPPEKPAQTEPDSISLRPSCRTDFISSPSQSLIKEEREPLPFTPPKSQPFIPPHLRPGFVGREERFGQGGQREFSSDRREKQAFRNYHRNEQAEGQGHVGEFSQNGQIRRPKSGGYERMGRAAPDFDRNRPRSGGNWPGSSGSYGSSPRNSPF